MIRGLLFFLIFFSFITIANESKSVDCHDKIQSLLLNLKEQDHEDERIVHLFSISPLLKKRNLNSLPIINQTSYALLFPKIFNVIENMGLYMPDIKGLLELEPQLRLSEALQLIVLARKLEAQELRNILVTYPELPIKLKDVINLYADRIELNQKQLNHLKRNYEEQDPFYDVNNSHHKMILMGYFVAIRGIQGELMSLLRLSDFDSVGKRVKEMFPEVSSVLQKEGVEEEIIRKYLDKEIDITYNEQQIWIEVKNVNHVLTFANLSEGQGHFHGKSILDQLKETLRIQQALGPQYKLEFHVYPGVTREASDFLEKEYGIKIISTIHEEPLAFRNNNRIEMMNVSFFYKSMSAVS